jgi:hypothetical protein
MKAETTPRGFRVVSHPGYDADESRGEKRVVQESSTIGDYEDSLSRPGSSYLWVGEHHHLNREEVAELAEYLRAWLATGRLF